MGSEARAPEVPSDVLQRRRAAMLRTIAVVDVLALLVVGAQPLLSGGLIPQMHARAFLPLIATGALLVVAMACLPWDRWTQGRLGEWLLHGLVATGLVAIATVVALSGGAESELFWLYVTTTTFTAVVYPLRTHATFGILTSVTYAAGIIVAPEPIIWGPVVFRIGILTIVAFTGAYVAEILRRSVASAYEARQLADRRATALSTVADAARAMAKLDREAILDEVAAAVTSLGYDVVGIYAPDETGRWRCTTGRIGSSSGRVEPEEITILSRVLAAGETIIVDDPTYSPAMLQAGDTYGIRSAIATPVLVQGHVAGVVIAGTTQQRDYDGGDREVFELIAGHAGRALELSDEFEQEHRMVLRLQELDEAKTDFLSTVSHELRTPLTIILGMSDILARTWDRIDVEDKQQLIQRIRENSSSLNRVIASLLDYARIEQGRLEVRSEPFDLSSQIRAVVDRLEPLLHDHHVTVEVPDELTVTGDAQLLERVIENLVSNAARHTPPGSAVTIRAIEVGAAVRVDVEDDGPGLRPEDIPHLGQRFFRGGDPETRSARGLGLGLALTGEVLRMHGSDLDIRSRFGEGASFGFTLGAPDDERAPTEHRTDAGTRD